MSKLDMYPYNIGKEVWDRFGVSINKPYVYSKPVEATLGYTILNQAYISTINLLAPSVLTNTTAIGPALDVDVAYDGRWRYNTDKTYDLYTMGDPYIALVDTNNVLHVKRGSEGTNLKLAENVQKCRIIRGWKHITDNTIDQGLMVFYIKDKKLYSRSYVEISPGVFAWQAEVDYALLYNIIDLVVYRTSDFRLAITVTKEDNTARMLLTTRVFPGQSIPTEVFNAKLTSQTEMIFAPLVNMHSEFQETFKEALLSNTNVDSWYSYVGKAYAYNDGNDYIYLCAPGIFKNVSMDQVQAALSFVDQQAISYVAISVERQGYMFKINISSMGNCTSAITISCAAITDSLGNVIPAFSTTFTPVGITPVETHGPLVIDAINANSGVV